MIATTARPGRVEYRPRLAPSAEYWEEEGQNATLIYGVTVFRTHDLTVARELAVACDRAHDGDGDLDTGELVWLARDRGRNWGRVGSGKRGSVPAVVFRVIS